MIRLGTALKLHTTQSDIEPVAMELNKLETDDIEVVVDDVNNYYITKGKADKYPTFISYLDWFYDTSPDTYEVTKLTKNVWVGHNNKTHVNIKPEPKVALYVMLKLLEKLDACKLVFFSGHLRCNSGAVNCKLNFFDDSKFIIQPTEKGNDKFITYTSSTRLTPPDFIKSIKPHLDKYKYTITSGYRDAATILAERGVVAPKAIVSNGAWGNYTTWNQIPEAHVNDCIDLLNEISTAQPTVEEITTIDQLRCKQCNIILHSHTLDTFYCTLCLSNQQRLNRKCPDCHVLLTEGRDIYLGVCRPCIKKNPL